MVSFPSCLVGFWGFHPYMCLFAFGKLFCDFKLTMVTGAYSSDGSMGPTSHTLQPMLCSSSNVSGIVLNEISPHNYSNRMLPWSRNHQLGECTSTWHVIRSALATEPSGCMVANRHSNWFTLSCCREQGLSLRFWFKVQQGVMWSLTFMTFAETGAFLGVVARL